MTTCIALTGLKGSGKSTLSTHLVSQGFTELSFAEPLKQMIITLFGIDPKWVYDPELKETIIPELGVSGRELCQVIGTDLFRDALIEKLPKLQLRGGSIWIHALLSKLDPIKNTVVSDCRFPNEYEALQQNNFTTICVVRPDQLHTETSDHASEKGCPYDDIILNAGDRKDLYDLADIKIEKLHSMLHTSV